MIAAVCPVVTDDANAANGYDIALNDTSPIPTSVQLTWGTSPSETLDPASGEGKVITSAATLQLGNSSGYTVYISGNPNLTGQTTGKTIPSTTSDKTLSQLENQWGYYGVISDAVATFDPSHSFKGMSTTQVAIAPEAESTGDVTKKVTVFFGARATGSQTADTYKTPLPCRSSLSLARPRPLVASLRCNK